MCEIALYVFDTILQKDFQIGRPICKSAGQSVIGRLARLADWTEHTHCCSKGALVYSLPRIAQSAEVLGCSLLKIEDSANSHFPKELLYFQTFRPWCFFALPKGPTC